MKVAIIGSGAMGSLFGGLLANAGVDVWLLARREEVAKQIKTHGMSITTNDGEVVAFPSITTHTGVIGTADLIIIFVKSAATRGAAFAAQELLGPATKVLTLQNGYGNAEELAAILGEDRVLAGTTAQGATLLAPGRIRYGGKGETHISQLSGGITPFLQEVSAMFTRAGIPTNPADNVISLLWGKLIVNVGINALTGLTGLLNGELGDYGETKEILTMAVSEAVAVATASGITLPYPDPLQHVLSIATKTAPNRSSLLQDLDHCRPTEIDAINGAIHRLGDQLGILTPANRILTLLVKMAEYKNEQSRR